MNEVFYSTIDLQVVKATAFTKQFFVAMALTTVGSDVIIHERSVGRTNAHALAALYAAYPGCFGWRVTGLPRALRGLKVAA